MFFILSKILIFFLMPFYWIILLLIWIWLSKNALVRKRLKMIIFIILIVFTNPFLYRSMVMLWQPPPTQLPKSQTYEAGIVLGGLSGYDKYEQGYFGDNADRFIQTANLYHQGIIKKIIVSGGTGSLTQNEPAESFFLRKEFIANGVKDTDIIIESRSRNTFENAIYSKQITDSLNLHPPFLLVTSALHMKRSASVFKKAGLNCTPFPCDYKVIPLSFAPDNTFLPNIKVLNEWSFFLKEVVGLVVYQLTGKA